MCLPIAQETECDRKAKMATRTDMMQHLRDCGVAFVLLSRVPLQLPDQWFEGRMAAALWAAPLVGLVLGIVGAVIGWAAVALGLTPSISAVLVLGAMIVMTGALHEDGLADTADGLWGGWDTENRLRIMKDSQIGTYGVLALFVVLGVRWLAIAQVLSIGAGFQALIAVAVLSRVPMVAAMRVMAPARPDGLAGHVGRPGMAVVSAALVLGLVIGMTALGIGGVLAVAGIMGLASLWIGLTAKLRIGGQTGDILGAMQQMSETAGWLMVLVLLS